MGLEKSSKAGGCGWDGESKTAWSEKLVLETVERNVRMVAGWQGCAIVPAMRSVDED